MTRKFGGESLRATRQTAARRSSNAAIRLTLSRLIRPMATAYTCLAQVTGPPTLRISGPNPRISPLNATTAVWAVFAWLSGAKNTTNPLTNKGFSDILPSRARLVRSDGTACAGTTEDTARRSFAAHSPPIPTGDPMNDRSFLPEFPAQMLGTTSSTTFPTANPVTARRKKRRGYRVDDRHQTRSRRHPSRRSTRGAMRALAVVGEGGLAPRPGLEWYRVMEPGNHPLVVMA